MGIGERILEQVRANQGFVAEEARVEEEVAEVVVVEKRVSDIEARVEDLVVGEAEKEVRTARMIGSRSDACGVCLEMVKANMGVVYLDCGHRYHLDCFMEMTSTMGGNCAKCPLEVKKSFVVDTGEHALIRSNVMKALEYFAEEVRIEKHGGTSEDGNARSVSDLHCV